MKLSVLLVLALLGLSSANLQDIVKKSSQFRKGRLLIIITGFSCAGDTTELDLLTLLLPQFLC